MELDNTTIFCDSLPPFFKKVSLKQFKARGDNHTMATKTKVTKDAAPKSTKTASPQSTGSGVAAKVSGAVAQPEPVSAVSESAKGAVKAKTQPLGEVASGVAESADSAYVSQIASDITAIEGEDKRWSDIKRILEKLKEDTLREIRKSVKNGTEAVAAIEPGGDIYDQASSERDRELGLLLGDREREKIHSIDEALLRIDEGEYGICEECDEDIPLGRLKAMPFTRHCVKCKSDLEKLQAQTKRVEEERAYREIPLGSEEEE